MHTSQLTEFTNGRRLVAHDDRVAGRVPFDLSDLIDADFESFLDTLSERLVGSVLLSDISYRVVGIEGDGWLRIEVSGSVSEMLKDDDAAIREVHPLPRDGTCHDGR